MEQLAADTEIAVSTIRQFSAGKANLTLDKLAKLMFVLDCSFDELLNVTIIDNSDDSDLIDDEYHAIKQERYNTQSDVA